MGLVYIFLLVAFASLTLEDVFAESLLGSPDAEQAPKELSLLDSSNGPEKRAAGFMPMRGRKAAFTPMRGKKTPYGGQDETSEDEQFYEYLKRAGFMPMRGRKSGYEGVGYPLYEGYWPLDAKRASGFMPMRGRKDMDNSMERLDQEDKRAAFHAVRGKKEFPVSRDGYSENGLWMDSASAPGTGGQVVDMEKRASPFFGMRG